MFTGTVASGGIPVDLYTLSVIIVRKKEKKVELNCNQSGAVKCNQSDLPLGEVVDWGMVLMLLNISCQVSTSAQRRWCHSANHSSKWNGLSHAHQSNATTSLQLESPMKQSSPAKQSQCTCSFTGSVAEMLKAS